MKQQLRSLKKTSIYIIAAALVAAIVIAVFFTLGYIRQKNNDKRLSEFSEGLSEDIEAFEDKYLEMPENEKKAKRNALREWLNSLIFGNSTNELLSLEEIKDILKEYPDEYTEIITRDDVYSVGLGSPLNGHNRFEEFVANCRLGKPDAMIINEVNVSLDSIYYYVEYDGNTFHVVEDKTRDGYEGDSGYSECFARYMKVEDYMGSDGVITEYAYLTNDISLSYAEVKKYFEDIKNATNPEEFKAPDFWLFYVATLTPEYIEQRQIAQNGYTPETVRTFTGFLDTHPYFCFDNPFYDYDGDGILDRVYRSYEPAPNENEMIGAYLFFGNGNTVTLNRNIWGMFLHTELLDVTGDGNKDICFFEYADEDEEPKYRLRVFENHNGNYILTRFPNKDFEHIEIINNNSGKSSFKCVEKDTAGNYDEYILSYENGEWISTGIEGVVD